ncbi:MFS transporter [Faecalicatena contorta]|uniref:MFS transporter n=1 Tax=Faecalicatena contorta TaxID=39482 RepID=UPI001F1E18F1|nr:MFS transporter [Faecalicatena contorta]MCF2682808.1 MFS transporter [Faecalicatena contorta]
MPDYRKTKRACYLGVVTQAIAANFAPLLFLKFHSDYHISLGNTAWISTCFFFTQLLVDLFCTKFVDRIGYRICIVASEICSAAGLIGLAFLPDVLPEPFVGIIGSVVVYAIGSGLIEVLCSPIVEACPFENKEATMSLLHSFYCWGSVGAIVISTLFFAVFGIDSWRWLAVLWAFIPAVNIYNFATCPMEPLVDEGKGMGIRELFRKPMFWIAVCLMVCSGASELSMAQWASAYAEATLGLSKTVGDLAGPCMFAVTMGINRVIFGKYGDRMDLMKFMTGSGVLCVICYLLASLSANPMAGLLGCILCGFSVGIMWPGTISIASKTFPAGGTAMFALLAMAGDLGGSIGPGIVGRVTQSAGDNIRAGMGVGLVFPVVLLIMLLIMKAGNRRK